MLVYALRYFSPPLRLPNRPQITLRRLFMCFPNKREGCWVLSPANRLESAVGLNSRHKNQSTGPLISMDTSVPRPEYPRPQFVRTDWLNLNGAWKLHIDDQNVGLEQRWFS